MPDALNASHGPGHGERLRIVVLGYLVRGPLGGMAWHHLQYVLGLHRLGHDVRFIEDSDDYASCVHPDTGLVNTDPSDGLTFTEQAMTRLGLGAQWAYYDAHTARWRGPAAADARDFCEAADIVLNVSGINPLRPWLRAAPRRVLIDTDPVFTQIRHLKSDEALRIARQHNVFFTFAETINAAHSHVPADGLPWRPTRQPIVLDVWPVVDAPKAARFTTVMQWDSYAAQTYQGRRFAMKSASFDPYFDLPHRVAAPLELAIGGGAKPPRQRMRAAGWHLRNPLDVTRDPWQYQYYIQQSLGEFSVAKQGYVAGRTGWFSERSANYLASGRPVVLQDTGFSASLPTGEGLFAFDGPDQAAAALQRVLEDWPRHSRAARRIAETHFDAHRVLHELVESAMGETKEACSP